MSSERFGVSPASKEHRLETLLERRKYVRLPNRFKTRVTIDRTSTAVEGLTLDVGQGGMFLSTPSWRGFQENDSTTVHLHLPPEMTGQPDTLILKGEGTVKRIEQTRKGVAIEFSRQLRTFTVSK
jgi:PilZ domain